MRFSRSLVLLGLLSRGLTYTKLSDESLRSLSDPGDDFNIKTGALLAPILQTRVPGTPGSTAVLTHFVDFFQQSLPKWNLTFQNSTSKTPLSATNEVPFVNLIATRDPPWATPGEVGRLALVAHYDSKVEPKGFIGATDSAAPCAMIMHAARSIDEALTKKWAAMEAEGVGSDGFDGVEDHTGVQVLLLDGEEAFQTWTHTDSIYGARSLAEEWEQTMHPAVSTYRTPLDSIELFLLLDLLGSANPTVPSYFKTTHWAYQRMAEIESRLRSLKQFRSSPLILLKCRHQVRKGAKKHRFFMKQTSTTTIGVEILHMIPAPFPHVWHTIDDDGEHLDIDTVRDWAKLVTAFTAEWMDLDGFFDTQSSPSSKPSHQKKTGGHVDIDRTEL
ncbi:hypothetical protein H2203_003458 [Taxawa tesnikishii (nom. ined.)]|nr:hypothetical protein H2203_003458 [Dothideales sp. JES 119]